MPEIILKNITKRWGNFYAADNLNLAAEDMSFVTLLGPSGCGKTTICRMLAGLETPEKGQIKIGEKIVFDSEKKINISPEKRNIGFLFQNYALWPNMTVYQNISFGLTNIYKNMPVFCFKLKNIDALTKMLLEHETALSIFDIYVKEKMISNDKKEIFDKALLNIIEYYKISYFNAKIFFSFLLKIYNSRENIKKAFEETLEKLNSSRKKILKNYSSQGFFLDEDYAFCKNNSRIFKMRKFSKEEIDLMVRSTARMVKISGLLDRYPNELSGGQQQRAAIARTLAPKPEVLLMDEPLSNIDAKLRLELHSGMQRLHLKTKSTFVYITHDQFEAMTLSTKICLIENGVIRQYDTPENIYSRPNSLFAADFLGNPSINFIEAKDINHKNHFNLNILGGIHIEFIPNEDIQDKNCLQNIEKEHPEKINKSIPFEYKIHRTDENTDFYEYEAALILGVRPEFISIESLGDFSGYIYSLMPSGSQTILKIDVNGYLLTALSFENTFFKIGKKIRFSINSKKIMLFSKQSQKLKALGKINVLK